MNFGKRRELSDGLGIERPPLKGRERADVFHAHLKPSANLSLRKGFASGAAVSAPEYAFFEGLLSHELGQILPPQPFFGKTRWPQAPWWQSDTTILDMSARNRVKNQA